MEKEEKRQLRKLAARLIASLSAEERIRKSESACRCLLRIAELQIARVIVLYAPLPDELDVWPAVQAFARAGKRIVMPRCIRETRQVLCCEVKDFERDLSPGTFGILEPNPNHAVEITGLDAVVSPGRAFDPEGNRVGRGVGYYDRFFARPGFRAFKCGLAFRCQVFGTVPIERHDVPMDALVTESGAIWPARSLR